MNKYIFLIKSCWILFKKKSMSRPIRDTKILFECDYCELNREEVEVSICEIKSGVCVTMSFTVFYDVPFILNLKKPFKRKDPDSEYSIAITKPLNWVLEQPSKIQLGKVNLLYLTI